MAAIGKNNDVILNQWRHKRLQEKVSELFYCKILGTNITVANICQYDRLSIQDENITGQYFEETGNMRDNQELLLQHSVTAVLDSRH